MKNSCTCREYILSGKMNRWAILLELQWRKARKAYQDCWSDESLQDAIEARENLTNQVSEQNWGIEGVKEWDLWLLEEEQSSVSVLHS